MSVIVHALCTGMIGGFTVYQVVAGGWPPASIAIGAGATFASLVLSLRLPISETSRVN